MGGGCGENRVAKKHSIEYPHRMTVTVEVPKSIASMRLPKAVHARLHALLDKQDAGTRLTASERKEAEGLVDMAEFLSLLKMRAARSGKRSAA
jgi:hypothetical protein